MAQFLPLKYAFDHVDVAGIRAPLRGNGRAPTESEKHLYRIISSECIANSTKCCGRLCECIWYCVVGYDSKGLQDFKIYGRAPL